MKKLILVLAMLVAARTAVWAQEGIVYQDMSAFPLYGKAHQEPGPRYGRLPERLHGAMRDVMWDLGCDAAGLYIRFRTDAPEIHAKWTNTGYHMPHMADCGVGGLDLYARIGGEWRFVGSGFDWGSVSTEHERRLVGNMKPEMREYMLYLSLYDKVKSLELGVPEGYCLEQPVLDSPRADAPVVMYGTSILQGGCASRPGMAHTNILSRRLDRTVINLGFSGNAKLDLEIAHLMAGVEHPAVFVLDYVPNSPEDLIREKGETFFRILRDRHPDVPVIFVEDPFFAHGVVDQAVAEEVRLRNEAQKELYQLLLSKGERNLSYIPAQGMTTSEDFVDGIHLTDLGMVHYAQHVAPYLEAVL